VSKGGDELSGGLQSLFQTARRAHDPTAADRARVDEAIASKLNIDGEAIAAASARAKPAVTRMFTVHGTMKLSVGIVCLAAASLAIMRWSESRSVTAPVAQRTPSSTPAITPPTPAPMPEEPTPHAAPRAFEQRAPASASKFERRTRRRLQPLSSTPPSAEVRSTTELRATNASLRPSPRVEAKASDVQSDTTSRAPSAPAPPAPESAAEPARAEQAVEVSSAHASSEAAPADTEDAWRSELMLVEGMHAALRKKDFSAALALCVEHERRWPHGEFELERDGVRAIAACGARSGDAGQRAQRYLDQHPRAPLAMRVRAVCTPQLTGKSR
jgi:hypothetical protein